MRSLRFMLLFAAPSLSAESAGAQFVIGVRDSLTTRVDSIFRVLDRTDSPGCALGVYRDGRILYARGYGMANLELGVPITPRSVFSIQSISKQFTAAAVLFLEQDGKLSLDDPVSRFFPEMPAYARAVTVRQLLNHTSGIRDLWTLGQLAYLPWNGIVDTLDALRLITHSTEPNFPPGTRYAYVSSGYILASQLVYRVSGRTLAAFLKERVFDPLHMGDTRSLNDQTLLVPGRAQGYARRGGTFRLDADIGDGDGPSGIHTTIEDFVRWDSNWESPVAGGATLAESLSQPSRLADGTTFGYGLGVFVGTFRGLRVVHHGGSGPGYRARYVRFPDQRLSVACFCNVTSVNPQALAEAVATVYLGRQMAPAISAWEAELLAAPAVVVPVEQLRRLAVGWYNSESADAFNTVVEGDSVLAMNGRRLVPLGGNRFRSSTGENVEWRFENADALAPLRLHLRWPSGGTMVYEAGQLLRLSTAELAEYAGKYRSQEIEATYTIARDSSRLGIWNGWRRLGTLQPTRRDAFVLIDASFSAVVEVARDARGRITGLVVQAGDVRNLRFERQF